MSHTTRFSALCFFLSACGSDTFTPSSPQPTPTPYSAAETSSIGYRLLRSAAHLDSPRTGVAKLFSSGNPNPASNEDYNQFLAYEGRDTFLLAEQNGPGVITRIWMTARVPRGRDSLPGFDSGAILNVETDGKLLFSTPLKSFFAGHLYPFVHPLVNQHINRNGTPNGLGFYSYVPISFAQSMRITVTKPIPRSAKFPNDRFFYQINVLDLAGEQPVTTSPTRQPDGSLALTPADQAALEEALQQWSAPGSLANQMDLAKKRIDFPGPLAGTATFAEIEGPGRIRGLRIHAPDIPSEALEKIRLRITWDDAPEPAVEIPLATGWGSTFTRGRFQALLQGAQADGMLYLALPMPFRVSALVELVNGGTSKAISGELYYDPEPVRDDALYLHTTFAREVVEAKSRFLALDIPGRGHLVGWQMSLDVLGNHNSMEGDEFFTVDGAISHRGTGFEDLFNAHWFFEGGVRSAPLHGATSVDGRGQPDIDAFRFFVPDAIPFSAHLRMEMENANLVGFRDTYRAVVFYYLAH